MDEIVYVNDLNNINMKFLYIIIIIMMYNNNWMTCIQWWERELRITSQITTTLYAQHSRFYPSYNIYYMQEVYEKHAEFFTCLRPKNYFVHHKLM